MPKKNADELARAAKDHLRQIFEQETRNEVARFNKLIGLENGRAGGPRRDTLDKITERMLLYKGVRQVNWQLRFGGTTPVLAENATFGVIAPPTAAGARYGFTCVLARDGGTATIPVVDAASDAKSQISCAGAMITSGVLGQLYRKHSREYLAAHTKALQLKEVRRVLDDTYELSEYDVRAGDLLKQMDDFLGSACPLSGDIK
jgi:hypothetical protein